MTPSWGNSFKNLKRKSDRNNLSHKLHEFVKATETKGIIRSRGAQEVDTRSEKAFWSGTSSRPVSPDNHVLRCQSFSHGCHSQPLPLPQLRHGDKTIQAPSETTESTPVLKKREKPAESPIDRMDNGKTQSHRLPLPPVTLSSDTSYASSSITFTNMPVSRSPGRSDGPTSPISRWRKGELIGRGTFGHVHVGFDSESGEMCAMKEVALLSDEAESRESVMELGREVAVLRRLHHQNIVRYYGSEMVNDKLYIYLEYVSGGSIHKLLQEYGQFGELAIRNYTHQILSGLAYLHAKNTVHRDIKGANILVDPNGCVKLADFGMAKHITGQSGPFTFKGSPYWMAPEVMKNTNGCSLAVDIWSLGCTVLEMATSKPPWSQYEGIAAMFKISNSKDLPPIPNNLSEDGKDFVRNCLQREPSKRPSAAELLQHPFVKDVAPVEKPALGSDHAGHLEDTSQIRKRARRARNLSNLDIDGLAMQYPKLTHASAMFSHLQRHSPRCIPQNTDRISSFSGISRT